MLILMILQRVGRVQYDSMPPTHAKQDGSVVICKNMVSDFFEVFEKINVLHFALIHLYRTITQPPRLFKSEQPWCRSQARINGEGCDRKGIRRKTQPNIFQCAL